MKNIRSNYLETLIKTTGMECTQKKCQNTGCNVSYNSRGWNELFNYLSKTRTVRGSDYSPAIELSEQKDKLRTATGDTKKYSKKTSQQSLVKFCLLVLKILSGNEILTSIKGRNSVANLQNLILYNPNLDIINVNVYTKFG